MRFGSAAVLLLLVLQPCHANRINDKRNQSSEVRSRRHDSEERTTSGRRWTTSRNSPYQKIVSSYEQGVPDLREAGSEHVETSTPDDPDQAKAKTSKRKQSRTSSSSHDQIPSEASSDNESPKATTDSSTPESADPQSSEARNHKPAGSTSRRRPTTIHPRENTVEPSTANPKKRRRPATTSVTTTTLAPQTMSDSLYQYFRPLDQDVPQDDIMPFLDFGRKLSPVAPTPSGANSIENKSMITKLRPRNHHEEKESNSSDEELLQEDMDVTVVKKAIERNSVPRGKLRVREQGISDYYRKRVPSQVRTTENLISTSDSSTASSVPGSKNIGMLKKINRHQIHHVQPLKIQEHVPQRYFPEVDGFHTPKNVEMLQEKRRQLLSRPIQRLAAIKQEGSQSPLTAESSLVKTVIKELPTLGSNDREFENNTMPNIHTNTTTEDLKRPNSTLAAHDNNDSTTPEQSIPNTQDKQNSKILSTAVVTSVSVQESLQDTQRQTATETPKEANKSSNANSTIITDHLPLSTETSKNTSLSGLPTRNFISLQNSTNSVTNNSSQLPANTRGTNGNTKVTTTKNDMPLRSREIYRPKAIPPGTSIPHLPRQIPFHYQHANTTLKPPKPHEKPHNTTLENDANLKVSTTPSKHTITTALVSSASTTPPTTTSTTSSPPTILSTATVQTIAKTQTTVNAPPKDVPTQEIVVTVPEEMPHSPANITEDVVQEYFTTNEPVSPTTLPDLPPINITNTNMTQPVGKEDEEESFTGNLQPPLHNEEINPPPHESGETIEQPSHAVETESVPPPKYDLTTDNLTIVPAYDDAEGQFPIYFTTVPTATAPVVDTRPETEAAVVEEQNNRTTPRPGADWVKVGAVNKDVEVVYPEPLGLGAYLLAGLGVVPIILGALIGARFIMAHNRKKVLDESEYSSEYNRSPLGVSTPTPLPTKLPRIPTHVSWGEREAEKSGNTPTITPVTPANARWEFPREKLRLQTVLGQGNFGQVWKAEADDIADHEGLTRLVAVKTVKESASAREREDLLRELGIMQELGSHPNVVTLLGCCTEKEPIYLIMEYVMYGKLLSFLRDHRTRAHYYNFSDATDALTSRDLTVFGYCVARGMDYLTNKSIIHRDMAARNVLVDHNKLCKIADFGMSRNVRDTGQIYEQRQSKGALPIRWMAPESLHFSLFTHKTDVWSFGILMWEIVTLGSTPYATMGAREVMRRVRDGYRLDRPSHCRPELFRVISKCWHSEPSKRPTFAELKVELGQLLSDSELNGSYVDLDSFADEMRRDTLHRHH